MKNPRFISDNLFKGLPFKRCSIHGNRRQQRWTHTKYILAMFPYPSGNLHMGHLRVYTISDVLARYHKQCGEKVIHPFGWDAFGLPAENAARQRNIDPEEWTRQNISEMKAQIQKMNLELDWDREIDTSTPEYYKFTQLLFLKLYQAGLVEKKVAFVNWDPVDKTVVANEQVNSSGRAERSGALVIRKPLQQWFFKITKYAQRLDDDLNTLKNWPEAVVQQQRNWIGRKEGHCVTFTVVEGDTEWAPYSRLDAFVENKRRNKFVPIDYIAIGPEHPLLQSIPRLYQSRMNDLLADLYRKEHLSVSGLMKTGLYARIKCTKYPIYVEEKLKHDPSACFIRVVTADRDMRKQSNSENVLALIKKGIAKRHTYYKLKDWLISRQRRWGTPIPMIHCPSCGVVPEKEENLPVLLSQLKSPVTPCPSCGNLDARRETDTMDTFVDSSWYWLRFLDPRNSKQLAAPEEHKTLPVDIYVGGIEHAIMHLLYSRFIAKVLVDQRIIQNSNAAEPFSCLLTQGLVQGQTFQCTETGMYISPDRVVSTTTKSAETETEKRGEPARYVDKETGRAVECKWEKMSKSKHNGVDPTTVIDKWGSDVTRLYILSKGHPSDNIVWDESGIVGMQRFLIRIEALVREFIVHKNSTSLKSEAKESLSSLYYEMNKCVDEVSRHLSVTFAFHNAISCLIKFVKVISNSSLSDPKYADALAICIKLLCPFAPGKATQMMDALGLAVHQRLWPTVDQNALMLQDKTVVIQVNGKKRAVISVPEDVLMRYVDGGDDLLQYLLQRRDVSESLTDIRTDTGEFLKPKKVILVNKVVTLVNLVI